MAEPDGSRAERVRRAAEEALREGPTEEEPVPAPQPRLNAVVERAVGVFGLGEWGEALWRYLGSLASVDLGRQWLGRVLGMGDLDAEALAIMLSAHYGLRELLGTDPPTLFAEYVLSKMRIVYNPATHTLQCFNPETGLYEPLTPSDECVMRVRAVVGEVIGRLGFVAYVRPSLTWAGGGSRTIARRVDLTALENSGFFSRLLSVLSTRGLNQYSELRGRSKYLIALPGRVYLDLGEDFVGAGVVRTVEASPEYYVDVKIEAPIDVALLRELAPRVPVVEPGADDWEGYRRGYIDFMVGAFRKYAPNLYGEFKKWVVEDEYVVLLLELIGFVMYPEYPIRAIFILLGGGNDPGRSGGNGKSTFLDLLTHIVGRRNVVHIEFQDLAENRFAASQLYGKLANIVGDMSARTIGDTSLLKALSGGDEVTVDVKYKPPITFVNRAKLIASMNELPVFNDQTKAIKDRLHIIPFPNTFPENPRYRRWLLSHPEVPVVATLGLTALRAVLYRGRFVTRGLTEVFNTTVDPVGEFMRRLLSEGVLGCRAVLDRSARTPREELYGLFERWREESNVARPVSKKVFTEQLSRWGIAVVRDRGDRHFYKGIQLTCEGSETIEGYSGGGESNEYNEE